MGRRTEIDNKRFIELVVGSGDILYGRKNGKPCDILHIVKLDDSLESAFLIQDMFPITEEYIEREYTIAGNADKMGISGVAL